MRDRGTRRILLKLVTLSVLVAGVFFFVSDRPEYVAHANDCYSCDTAFPTCNNTCNPNNAVPCYGDCQTTYANCLYGCGNTYPRTPIVDPSASCWENAVRVYDHCVVGAMPGQSQWTPDYAGIYAQCMLDNNNDVSECCSHVQQAWWELNGPYCY